MGIRLEHEDEVKAEKVWRPPGEPEGGVRMERREKVTTGERGIEKQIAFGGG